MSAEQTMIMLVNTLANRMTATDPKFDQAKWFESVNWIG
jgi:hypothetical protein